jgi:energy-converting hydrogenase Eha subunit A
VLTAVRDALTGTFVDFRITPKASVERPPLPWRVILPYALLATIPIVAVIHFDGVRNAAGFYLLALMNSLVYTIILGLIVIMHARENRYRWPEFATHLSGKAIVAVAIAAFLVFGGKQSALYGLHGITSGASARQMSIMRR